ncbi:recombination protein O [Listeria grayi FSL F6-1183]|uniref:Recombination protein O n=1 Tax=Listeria grayi FSL F6-1183 TaxID=1265827 RepID=A0A829R9A7_LISGR|nr:recombination protein O [Listeria grayi FSL F6-1183]
MLRKVIDTYYQEKTGLYLKSKKFLLDMEKWLEVLDNKKSD